MVWEELDAGTKKVLTMQKLDAHIIKKEFKIKFLQYKVRLSK
jgi:hypothetical protein